MPSTGQKCQESGVYRSKCCSNEIPLSKGETFPPCAACRKGADWTLVRRA